MLATLNRTILSSEPRERRPAASSGSKPARQTPTIVPKIAAIALAIAVIGCFGINAVLGKDDKNEGSAPVVRSAPRLARPNQAVRRPGLRQAEEVPVCPRHSHKDARPADRRVAGNGFVFGEEMYERMMLGLARGENPVEGMRDVMKRHERETLSGFVLSPQEERAIGMRQRDQYLTVAAARGNRVVAETRDLAYVRTLVGRLSARMRHRDRYPDIEVTLIRAPEPDGRAFPGGLLVFTTAILELPDEASVAAVVAHELAHLDLAHVYHYAKRAKLAEAPMAVDARDPAAFRSRGLAFASLFMNPYLPEHELEADCTAATWMYLEGYDPTALARFFEMLQRRQRDLPDAAFVPSWRSHPYTLHRRDEVLARLVQLQRWRPRADLGLYPGRLEARDGTLER